MSTPALELDSVSKHYGGLQVARNVRLTLPHGARHALIGPNGAGKTTLVHLISGLVRPNAGRIRLGGTDVTHYTPERRVACGLARTFQINSLFSKLTVAENVGLAINARVGVDMRPFGNVCRAEMMDEAAALLETMGLLAIAHQRIANLAYGQRRLVEIALALALKPKILLLDEPASGIAAADRKALLQLLMQLPADLSILVIEHDMSLVFRFAERIVVLVEGAVLTEGAVSEVRNDPRVRDVYLGTHTHA
jgi:branched-chain amino acid transport system ATP-binding protein